MYTNVTDRETDSQTCGRITIYFPIVLTHKFFYHKDKLSYPLYFGLPRTSMKMFFFTVMSDTRSRDNLDLTARCIKSCSL